MLFELSYTQTFNYTQAFNIIYAQAFKIERFSGIFLCILLFSPLYDSTISAGPLLTTTTDVLGFAFFLGLAKLLIR